MNRLLRALPARETALFEREAESVQLDQGMLLFDTGSQIDRIYFPESGVISLVSVLSEGQMAEITTVGREGFVNVGSLLDDDVAIARHTVQVSGRADVVSARLVRAWLVESAVVRSLLLRYTQAFIGQIAQGVACNGVHGVHERMARWLLMAHDRTDGDEVPLTQEFLAEMLGVRRPTVTVVARTLQTAGLIRYSRGRIVVTDRAGLEEASCECYGIVRQHFRRLVPELV